MDERIVIGDGLHRGLLLIRGTTVPVHVILRDLARTLDDATIIEQYKLDRKDVRAALEYAAERVAEEQHYPKLA